jgi:hypothetical protein
MLGKIKLARHAVEVHEIETGLRGLVSEPLVVVSNGTTRLTSAAREQRETEEQQQEETDAEFERSVSQDAAV